MSDIEQLIEQMGRWQSSGEQVALATVVQTWGSSPRAVGSHLAVNEHRAFVGSVSGGCIEAAVIGEALRVINEGLPRLFDGQIADEQAWELGLSCGGRMQVYVEKVDSFKYKLFEQVQQLYAKKQSAAIITRLADGAQMLFAESDSNNEQAGKYATELEREFFSSKQVYREALDALRCGRGGLLPTSNGLFLNVYRKATHLFVVGAVHIAQCLASMAKQAGFALTIIDPRTAFATKERFADAPLITDWPDEALAKAKLTAADAVITLTHDPKLDDVALATALRSPAFYIGALGSKRSHVQRVARLRALGFDGELDRIHAPVGLPLGGRAPAEIAVSILAQVIQERHAL